MARSGRRPGQNETRDEILAAARKLFAERGYDGATVRAIAAEAGVNAALLNHFFGGKQQLFVAAMELPLNPAEIIPSILEGPPEHTGERLVRFFLRFWSEPSNRSPILALLRSAATHEQASVMMRQFLDRTVLAEVAKARGLPKVRVAAAAAQLMGVVLLRYVIGIPALADATDDELAELLGPTIQRYLDG